MTHVDVSELVRQINSVESPKLVAYIAGGGTEVLPMLLADGGGSATLLAARIPYSQEDFQSVMGSDPGNFVDARAARGLAMSAFRHALTIRGKLRPDQVIGLGSTSKLTRGEGERLGRTHEIHAALQTDSSTTVWSLVLPEGATRAWEERINAILILNMLAIAKGIEGTVPLEHEGRSIPFESLTVQKSDSRECRNVELSELLAGHCSCVVYDLPFMSAGRRLEGPRLLLPGSFRPLHAGHVAMAEVASRMTGLPCGFEISLFHPEKPPLDYVAIRSRLKGFEAATTGLYLPKALTNNEKSIAPLEWTGLWRLYLTKAPTYIEKARLFPNCTFVVGHDTAMRIFSPRFYGGNSARDAMVEELESLGTKFLIFGRVDSKGRFQNFAQELFEDPVSSFLAGSAATVPEHLFRLDLSSTEVRQNSSDDYA